MPENSLVSIVIPLFNKEKFIKQTLQTVINQDYENWECVIVDDGSTDESLSIVKSFVNKTKFSYKFKIIESTNFGQARTRNIGINSSIGKYIALLDSDDLWSPNKLKSQIDYLINHPNKIGVLCPYFIFHDSHPQKKLRFVSHFNFNRAVTRWASFIGFGLGLESNLLIQRNALDQVGFFDEELSTSSGLDLAIRIRNRGKLGISRSTFIAYRISASQWHKSSPQLIRDVSVIQKKHANMLSAFQKNTSSFYLDFSNSPSKLIFVMKSIKSKRVLYSVNLMVNIAIRNFFAYLLGSLCKAKFRTLLKSLF